MFDVIADEIQKEKYSKEYDYVEFAFDKDFFPDGSKLFRVFQIFSLKVECKYYFNGELRIHHVTLPPADADDDVVERCDDFESSLSMALEKNGFEWDEDADNHIINIYGTST